MASEQGQDGWNSATNTFPSEDYSMKTWGDEEPAHVEETEKSSCWATWATKTWFMGTLTHLLVFGPLFFPLT